MPPLKGIDRGINGELLQGLELSGHGDRIVIVDPSYSIPVDAESLDYQGDSSARAFKGILDLVPWEGVVTIMAPDPPANAMTSPFYKAIKKVYSEHLNELPDVDFLPRYAEQSPTGVGFYDLANNIYEKPTLFVRTRDSLAYACATFIVGHSQE